MTSPDSGRGVNARRVLTVAELTGYIKRVFEVDPLLSEVSVAGEISNLRRPSSGHLYFTLKDDSAQIRCVMFRGQNYRLAFQPQDGQAVLVFGYVSLYERDGQYQLYAQELRPAGLGDLHQAFEQLKAKLTADGLFAAALKRPLPLLPGRVAIVTSPTGAALRDVLRVAERRHPGLRVVVVPSPVQGEGAAALIARALSVAADLPGVEVIILTRGGGSLEELWAFNEEAVARAIRACRVPVVAGIGHETDVTIADLAADVRASTPSAAAELVFPDGAALTGHTRSLVFRLRSGLRNRASTLRRRLERLAAAAVLTRPDYQLSVRAQRLDSLAGRLARAARAAGVRRRQRLAQAGTKLDAISPLAVLGRGYAVCTDSASGAVLRRADAVHPGQRVDVRLSGGRLACLVENVCRNGCGNDATGGADDEYSCRQRNGRP